MKLNNLTLGLLPFILYGCASISNVQTSNSQQLNQIQDRYRQATINLLDNSKFSYSGEIKQQIIHRNKDAQTNLSHEQRKTLQKYLQRQGVLWNVGQINHIFEHIAEYQSSQQEYGQRSISNDDLNLLKFLNQATMQFDGSVDWQQALIQFNLNAKYQNDLLKAETRIPVVLDLKDNRVYTQLAGVLPQYLSQEDQKRYFYSDFTNKKKNFEHVNWKLLKQYLQEQMSLIYLLGEPDDYQIIQPSTSTLNNGISEQLKINVSKEELELQSLLFNVVNYHHIYRNILGYKKFNSSEINAVDSYDLKYALTVSPETIENYISEFEEYQKYEKLSDKEKEQFWQDYHSDSNTIDAAVAEEEVENKSNIITIKDEIAKDNLKYAAREQLHDIYIQRIYNENEQAAEASYSEYESSDESYSDEYVANDNEYEHEAAVDAVATDAMASDMAATDAAAAATDAATIDDESYSEQEEIDIKTCLDILNIHKPEQLNATIYCRVNYDFATSIAAEKQEYLANKKLLKLMEIFNQYKQDQFINAKQFQSLWFTHESEIKDYLKEFNTLNNPSKLTIESGLNSKGQLNYQTLKATLPLEQNKIDLAVQIDMNIRPNQSSAFDRAALKDAKELNSLRHSNLVTSLMTDLEGEYAQADEEEIIATDIKIEDKYSAWDYDAYIDQSIYQSYSKFKDPIKAYKTGFLLTLALHFPSLLEQYSSDELEQFSELNAYHYYKYNDQPINEKKYAQLMSKFGKTRLDYFEEVGSSVDRQIEKFQEYQGKLNIIKKHKTAENKFSALYSYLYQQEYQYLIDNEYTDSDTPDFKQLPKYANTLAKIYQNSRQGKPLNINMLKNFESSKELNMYINFDIYGDTYEFLEKQ